MANLAEMMSSSIVLYVGPANTQYRGRITVQLVSRFTALDLTKPVKQETSWPVILPTKVSVLCWVQCYMLSSFTNATMLCNGTGPQPLSMVSNHTSKYWSDGRLMFQRLWVQIPAPYNGFTFICCINYSVCLKRRKWGRSSPIFSKKYRSDHQLWQKSFKLPVPAGDATVNVTNVKGTSALHLASENGHPEIVDILLKSGSVITASDNKGNSALHYAASNGHLDIVRMLVEIGGSDVEA